MATPGVFNIFQDPDDRRDSYGIQKPTLAKKKGEQPSPSRQEFMQTIVKLDLDDDEQRPMQLTQVLDSAPNKLIGGNDSYARPSPSLADIEQPYGNT